MNSNTDLNRPNAVCDQYPKTDKENYSLGCDQYSTNGYDGPTPRYNHLDSLRRDRQRIIDSLTTINHQITLIEQNPIVQEFVKLTLEGK